MGVDVGLGHERSLDETAIMPSKDVHTILQIL